MAYDAARGRTVLFGGHSGTGWLYETHEWDGTNWITRQTSAAPATRWAHALAFDEARARVVLFGGFYNDGRGTGGTFGDTWEYGPVDPATYAPFGAGCASTSGTASLGSDRGSLPWIGQTFTARLTDLGVRTGPGLAFLLLGASRSMWGTVPLPLALDGIGMRGCSLYADPAAIVPLVSASGTATATIRIPILTTYVGVTLYNQGGAVDAGANQLGVTMTNACAMVIGSQ
jgi:hypothetical protein